MLTRQEINFKTQEIRVLHTRSEGNMDSQEVPSYELSIFGPFSVVSEEIGKIHINREKEKAIIAILCLSPNHCRTRAFIKGILWGDSSESKASANLRNAIWKIKKEFFNNASLLNSDHDSIWLENDYIKSINYECSTELELLEGIDISEEPFEDWLREKRSSFESQYSRTSSHSTFSFNSAVAGAFKKPRVCVLRPLDTQNSDFLLSDLLLDISSRLVSLELFDVRESTKMPALGVVLRAERFYSNRVVLKILNSSTGKIFWSYDVGSLFSEEIPFISASEAVTEALLNTFATELSDPSFLLEAEFAKSSQTVLDGVFRPGTIDVENIEGCIANLVDIAPSSVLHGLKNCVRMYGYGERISGYHSLNRDAVEHDLRRSMELDSSNPLVLALASHTSSLYLGDFRAAQQFSESAISRHPRLALVASLHALTLLRSGYTVAADKWSSLACKWGSSSRYHSFYLGTRSCTQAALGNFKESIGLANMAKLNLPGFKALDKLLFLGYASDGQNELAERLATHIKLSEPDFGSRLLADTAPTVGINIIRKQMLISAKIIGLP